LGRNALSEIFTLAGPPLDRPAETLGGPRLALEKLTDH
jgi:hypothetical protein